MFVKPLVSLHRLNYAALTLRADSKLHPSRYSGMQAVELSKTDTHGKLTVNQFSLHGYTYAVNRLVCSWAGRENEVCESLQWPSTWTELGCIYTQNLMISRWCRASSKLSQNKHAWQHQEIGYMQEVQKFLCLMSCVFSVTYRCSAGPVMISNIMLCNFNFIRIAPSACSGQSSRRSYNKRTVGSFCYRYNLVIG